MSTQFYCDPKPSMLNNPITVALTRRAGDQWGWCPPAETDVTRVYLLKGTTSQLQNDNQPGTPTRA